MIVCFLSLISRAGSSNVLSACREGEGRWLGGIVDKVIRMYIIKVSNEATHNREQITTIFNQIKKAMRTKQEKKDYSAPRCMIIQVSETTYLMDTSYPGQHNPAQSGGTSGDAKQTPSWMSESEEETENSSWED